MIKEDEVFKIGRFLKPHGIKGEIAFSFDNDIFDKVDCPYLICNIEGIFVPFFIKEYRFKGADTALITFEDITDNVQAKRFQGLDVYFSRKYYEEDEDADYSLDYFIGFVVVDKIKGDIGRIIDIDDATINTLFLLNNEDGEEIIVPASEDFIVEIDVQNKVLHVELPEGLI
ncbi:MAG: ribosome maturation factor RimM [Dysgonomonas sp.]|nr:ribosome maturation factor RimM [Dysgonomonas sp.]